MNESQVERLIKLFEGAIKEPVARRDEFVQRMCGSDTALRHELSSLLVAHESAGEYFDSLERDLITPVAAAVFGTARPAGGPALLADLQLALGDDYRLGRELGGGMSRVFLAQETRLHRDVVIKVMPPDLAESTRIDRFTREIQLAAQLQHPHIVPLLTSDSAGSFLYYTMPFVAGESLRERLARDGPLAVRDARDIWRDVLDALTHAHASGVVHRDIKPANILLSGRNALVADFGIARALEAAGGDASETAPGLTIGTPAYMAPEQVTADRNADHRVDLYAAGLVMYEMLEGRLPFAGESTRELLLARLTQDPSPMMRAGCPPELARLVMRCLARAPGDRHQTAEALLAELEAVPFVATGADTGGVNRPRRARRVLIGALAAAGLVAASLGTWQLMKTRADARLTPSTLGPAIAVLPVTTISSDSRDTVFAAGLTEDLIATLARAGNLRVSPTLSVLALRDRGLDVRQIAESLRVSHVLVSGLQKDGQRLRFQVRLVDPRDGSTRWRETYNRELSDLFAMQDDIARAVGREVGARLVTGRNGRLTPRRYTPSIAAYQAYVDGTNARLTNTPAGRAQAIVHLNRAIATDSNFAPAYAALAQLHIVGAGGVTGQYREAFSGIRELALKAVALDDSLGAAHAALGWAQMSLRNWTEAEVELKRAVELDPQAPRGFEGLARLYMYTGRPAEQLAAARNGEQLAPYTASAIRELALALSVNGQCDEAIEALTPFRTLTPAVGVAGVVRGQCYAAMAKWPEAIAEFRWAMDNSDARTALAFLGYALARSGQRDEAIAILRDLETGRKYSHGAFGIATLYAGLGNYDKAFIYLAKAVEENSIRIYLMGPMFAELRRDPRFADIRKRMGV